MSRNRPQVKAGQRWRSRDKRDYGMTCEVIVAPEGQQFGWEFVTVKRAIKSTMRVRTLWQRYDLITHPTTQEETP